MTHYITRPISYSELQAGQKILYNHYRRPATVHIVETVKYAQHTKMQRGGHWRGLETAKNIRLVIIEMPEI